MDPRRNKLDAFLLRPQKEGIPEENGEQALEHCDSAGLSFTFHLTCSEINPPITAYCSKRLHPSFG
jgi:hypothetical protein